MEPRPDDWAIRLSCPRMANATGHAAQLAAGHIYPVLAVPIDDKSFHCKDVKIFSKAIFFIVYSF